MPPPSTSLHMPKHQSGEGFSFLQGDIHGHGDVVQVSPMGVLSPPLSSEVGRVPGAKATQLDWGSRWSSSSGGECSASWAWSRLALSPPFESILETRPTPSSSYILRVQLWSLSNPLGDGSLTPGGEPLSTAYRGCLVLQLIGSLPHQFQASPSPYSSGVSRKGRGLHLLFVGSS